jgi:hypothetical protein
MVGNTEVSTRRKSFPEAGIVLVPSRGSPATGGFGHILGRTLRRPPVCHFQKFQLALGVCHRSVHSRDVGREFWESAPQRKFSQTNLRYRNDSTIAAK